jgi:hypothetical protein
LARQAWTRSDGSSIETLDIAELGKVPPRGDERLLDGVSTPDVTQDPMRDDEQSVSRTANDGGEGLSSSDRAAR